MLCHQLELACKYKKPILLHERDAYTDFMAIIVKYQSRLPPVVIHCFTGTREQALVYVAMGFYIGVTGIYFARSQLYDAASRRMFWLCVRIFSKLYV